MSWKPILFLKVQGPYIKCRASKLLMLVVVVVVCFIQLGFRGFRGFRSFRGFWGGTHPPGRAEAERSEPDRRGGGYMRIERKNHIHSYIHV